MRIGKQLSSGAFLCLDILDDVTLEIEYLNYVANAAIISFKLINFKLMWTLVDIEIDGDIFLRRVDDAPIASIAGGRGMVVYTEQYALTFLLRSSPIVTDVSSYWFGNPDDIPANYWNQTTSDLFYGDDSGLVFSWQGINLAPLETVTKAVIVKFGLPDANKLNLTLNVTSVPSTLDIAETINLHGVVTSANLDATIWLLILLDSDLSKGWKWKTEEAPGGPFALPFSPRSYGAGGGSHTFWIYAFDEEGTLSAPAKIVVTVVAPSKSPSQSPVATRTAPPTATKRRTPTRSRSRPPAPTLPPSPPALAMRVTPGDLDDFEITGVSHTFFEIHFSGEGLGFTTGLKIGKNLSETAVGCLPYHFQNVTLFTEFVNLSTNAVLVVLRLQNDNKHDVVVSLESDSGTLLNYDDAASIAALSDGRGVVVYSFKYALTIIGRGAPLVTDATALWFGDLLEMILFEKYFSQGQGTTYFGGEGGLAFSWHNISLSAGGSTTKTFAIKWGLPDTNKLLFALDPVPEGVGKLTVIGLSGLVTSTKSPELVSIFVVIDANFSNIRRVAIALPVNVKIDFAVNISTFGLKPGQHNFTVCAVDSVGTFSNGESFTSTLGPPSPTSTISPQPTDSGSNSNKKKKKIALYSGVGVGALVVIVIVIVAVVCCIKKQRTGLNKRVLIQE
jgi:hypothetical protein